MAVCLSINNVMSETWDQKKDASRALTVLNWTRAARATSGAAAGAASRQLVAPTPRVHCFAAACLTSHAARRLPRRACPLAAVYRVLPPLPPTHPATWFYNANISLRNAARVRKPLYACAAQERRTWRARRAIWRIRTPAIVFRHDVPHVSRLNWTSAVCCSGIMIDG